MTDTATKPTPTLNVATNADGSRTVTWSNVALPRGGVLLLDGAFIDYVAAGTTSVVDKTPMMPSTQYGYTLDRVGPDSISAQYTSPASPPPPALPSGVWGAYDDGNPSGTDDWNNIESLVTGLQGVAPAGKTVKLSLLNTYGTLAGGFVPANGQPLPAGTFLLLGFGIAQTAYAAGGPTLLSQMEAETEALTALMQYCVKLVGPGHTLLRPSYEVDGNYPGNMVGGALLDCLYPPEDHLAALTLCANVGREVDSTAIVDFCINGNGPNGLLDQWGQPVINRCPLSLTDVISVDSGLGAYGVAHAYAVVELAETNGKAWAIDECGDMLQGDGTELTGDIANLAALVKGQPALDRGNSVTVQAKAPAAWTSLFDTDDSGAAANLLDADNATALAAWALAIAS